MKNISVAANPETKCKNVSGSKYAKRKKSARVHGARADTGRVKMGKSATLRESVYRK